MKKNYLFLSLSILVGSLVAENYPKFGDYSSILDQSEVYKVNVNNVSVPVYEFDPLDNTHRVDFAWINLTANSRIEIETKQPIEHYKITPVTYGIKAEVQTNKLEFSIGEHNYFQIEINDLHTLIVIADTKEYQTPNMKDPKVVSISEFDIDSSGNSDDTEILQEALEFVSEIKGTLYFPAGVYNARQLLPKSNTRIYLDFGAVINTVDEASKYEVFRKRPKGKRAHLDFIMIEGQENVSIEGPGIINANGISLALSAGVPDPMPYKHGEIENVKMTLMALKGLSSKNLVVQDVLVLESTGWAITFFDCDETYVNRAKIINYADWYWSDGVHFTSCRDALAESCYAFCGDDAYVATTRLANAPTKNVIFRDNVAGFTTCTGLRAGWYARDTMDDVLFENNIIVSAGRGIDVLHYGYEGKAIRNVTFRNTIIEEINDDGSTWQNRCPIFMDMRKKNEKDKDPGLVKNVTVERFKSFNQGPHPSTIKSWSETGYFTNVRFKDVEIAGNKVLRSEDGNIEINEWSKNVTFE